MPRRKRRSDRKLHRWYLHLGVIDASVDRGWRERLFAAELFAEFPIDCQHTQGLPEAVARGIRRYRLAYVASRIPSAPPPFAALWFEGCEWFCFKARGYPDIVSYSANNPQSL
jgi:hypothetical protein